MQLKAKLQAALFSILCTLPLIAMAQEIPCSEAPKNAVVVIPAPANNVARVICTKYGHFITGADGVVWTYPGALAPAMLISYLEMANSKTIPPEVDHTKHFSSIEASQVPPPDILKLLADDGLPPPSSPASISAIEIRAKNQDGALQRAYIFTSGRERWGYLCDPKCSPRNTFMVLDMRRQGNGT